MNNEKNDSKKALQHFIDAHVARIKPLEIAARRAYWQAAVSGDSNMYRKAAEYELKIREIYSNPREFEYVKKIREKQSPEDYILKRQTDILYFRYLQNQIPAKLRQQIVESGNKIEERFSTFRPELNGKKVTDNQILQILKEERNLRLRREAWLAGKQVGRLVADELIRLVRLRNQAARHLGFDNYHQMALRTDEQEPEELDYLFDLLESRSKMPFLQAKNEMDSILAQRYQVNVNELKPWHYEDPFFQETPLVYSVNLDSFYQKQNVEALARVFFQSIGLPVDDILAKSDLYERPGKNPHAFCEDIDKEGDVRILCNLKNNETWMETILHESGHALYDKHINRTLPYLLREQAHIFTTEGIAMLFGRLSRNPFWMQTMLGLSGEQRQKIESDLFRYMRLKQLIFVRWVLVMYHFEKQLYLNPEQNLNTLWWKLVRKYQYLNPPEERNYPHWAAKIHFTIAPCYYHNYLLGEMFASQVHRFIVREIYKGADWRKVVYIGEQKVGNYLKEKIFKVGKLYHWKDMIKQATGYPLKPDDYVDQFFREE